MNNQLLAALKDIRTVALKYREVDGETKVGNHLYNLANEAIAGYEAEGVPIAGKAGEAIAADQIKQLADFIMKYYPNEPGSKGFPESAATCAMRLLSPMQFNQREAILAFIVYWASNEKVVSFKTGYNPANIEGFLNRFCDIQKFAPAREGYLVYLKLK
jgi:hypothetical protein